MLSSVHLLAFGLEGSISEIPCLVNRNLTRNLSEGGLGGLVKKQVPDSAELFPRDLNPHKDLNQLKWESRAFFVVGWYPSAPRLPRKKRSSLIEPVQCSSSAVVCTGGKGVSNI